MNKQTIFALVTLFAIIFFAGSASASYVEWTLKASDRGATLGRSGNFTGYFDVNTSGAITNYQFSGSGTFTPFTLNSSNSQILSAIQSGFGVIDVTQSPTQLNANRFTLVTFPPVNFAVLSASNIPLNWQSFYTAYIAGVSVYGAYLQGTLTSTEVSSVPLPASLSLFGITLFGLAVLSLIKRRSSSPNIRGESQ